MPSILDHIEDQTKTLLREKLRSKAVVISRLSDLINEANDLGHPHTQIHARIVAAGLDTSLKNYQTYLYRANKARARAMESGSYEPGRRVSGIGSYEPKLHERGGLASPEPLTPAAPAQQSPTAVLDALQSATNVGSRDFSSVVRERLKTHKGQNRKE